MPVDLWADSRGPRRICVLPKHISAHKRPRVYLSSEPHDTCTVPFLCHVLLTTCIASVLLIDWIHHPSHQICSFPWFLSQWVLPPSKQVSSTNPMPSVTLPSSSSTCKHGVQYHFSISVLYHSWHLSFAQGAIVSCLDYCCVFLQLVGFQHCHA